MRPQVPQLGNTRTRRVPVPTTTGGPQPPTATTDPGPTHGSPPANPAALVLGSNPGPFSATPPTPDELRERYGLQSQLEPQAAWDPVAGTWTWAGLTYPKKCLTDKLSRREQVLFYRDIGRLLKGPPPAPWGLVARVVVAAMKQHQWQPDSGLWLSWAIEASRHGDMQPALQQLRLIESDWGPEEARRQWFLRLYDHLKSGMPWSDKLAADQVVQAELNWALSAKNEWALCLLCAQRGDATPLIDLLAQAQATDLVDRERLGQLLALCQNPQCALTANALVRLIDAAQPHLGPHDDLRQGFKALRETRQWRQSRRAPLAGQALAALGAWFTFETTGDGTAVIRTSRAKAPATKEDQARFEALLFSWMDVALQDKAHAWSDLLGIVTHLEGVWRLRIDRVMLLDLCLAHARRARAPKVLLDHLQPPWQDERPHEPALLAILGIASDSQLNDIIRAALIQRLWRWVHPTQNIELVDAGVRAVLSLPPALRDNCIEGFVATYGGGSDMRRWFGRLAEQGEATPPDPAALLEAALPAVPQFPPQVPWPACRALSRVLLARVAPALWQAMRQNPKHGPATHRVFDALARLATPTSGALSIAIPQLFDLVRDLADALPPADRLSGLQGLFNASLEWPGAPALQAAWQGALQALIAYATPLRDLPPPPETNQPVVDEAAVLFAHGFLSQLAARDQQEESRRHWLNALSQRFDRSITKNHAPDIAQLIHTLFKPKPLH